jgi:hypothetical protein
MAFAIPFITAAAGALSIATGIKSLVGGKKSSSSTPSNPEALPKTPNAADASESAEKELKKRRKISVLSGGNTDKTRGQALAKESDVTRKSLVGE